MAVKKTAAPKPVTFNIDAADFLRGLNNAWLFAGRDIYLPVLRGVQIEGNKSGLRFIATDRYLLGVTTVEAKVPTFTFLVRGDDVVLLTKLFNPKSGDLTVTVGDGAMRVEPAKDLIGAANVVVTCPPEEGKYPDVDKILDGSWTKSQEKPEYKAGDVLGLNPRYLAKFARVKSDHGDNAAMRVTVTSAQAPVLVSIGDNFRGCIMPVRLSEYDAARVTPKESAA